MSYTAEQIRAAVEADRERLFASWAVGRPEGWTCDQRTKDIVCLQYWLREELTRLLGEGDPEGRRAVEGVFYRATRGATDVFELAAEVMNDAAAGNIERNRIPHKRWG